ncbi:MAG: dihydroorotase [Thermotogota bacterium]|nr:dihydroorotase [Thermotogota bacterium]
MNHNTLLIKNALVCDKDTYEKKDVLIENGFVKAVEKNISVNCKVIDGNDQILMPAFVDLHAHFRDPGYTKKEDILTGSRAAIKGGYTTVNLMANTFPICNDNNLVDRNLAKAKEIDLIDIFQVCSITKDFSGKDCQHIEKITTKGCKMISDDGNGVESDAIMKTAMEIAFSKGLMVSSHAEYKQISKTDTRKSENLMTQRDLSLCEETKAHLHMAHVSTKEAIEMITKAKSKGVNVTCECTPHHLVLTDTTSYKVHPPLRKQDDVDALIKGIHDKTVDCIATDHAPHTTQDKNEGAPGMTGIELAFSICYTYLVKTKKITLMKLSELLSYNPAQILGVNKGIIQSGIVADLTLIDPNKEFEVNGTSLYSKGKNTPFEGKRLKGKVKLVIKDGIVKYENNHIVERRKDG